MYQQCNERFDKTSRPCIRHAGHDGQHVHFYCGEGRCRLPRGHRGPCNASLDALRRSAEKGEPGPTGGSRCTVGEGGQLDEPADFVWCNEAGAVVVHMVGDPENQLVQLSLPIGYAPLAIDAIDPELSTAVVVPMRWKP